MRRSAELQVFNVTAEMQANSSLGQKVVKNAVVVLQMVYLKDPEECNEGERAGTR